MIIPKVGPWFKHAHFSWFHSSSKPFMTARVVYVNLPEGKFIILSIKICKTGDCHIIPKMGISFSFARIKSGTFWALNTAGTLWRLRRASMGHVRDPAGERLEKGCCWNMLKHHTRYINVWCMISYISWTYHENIIYTIISIYNWNI